ncbi:uncharacterized protein LOC113226241 [Hyposmocoma kahamanoa]|uniref:uncharacterized protein LOC113226241 n=1 Tax=Hyposmocoma kahamanoa TaxID=1477025 RepID=UPI000E6D5F7F|nr:uncharacterized protein LOC113226241 [Hyposmocoma kahamanoa]
MPNQVEQKVIDPEAELSNVQRTFQKLAPMCSVEKRAQGIPQLAPQEKQLSILAHELKETLLCINLAKKGQHAIRDAQIRSGMHKSIVEYEQLEAMLRDENAQQDEVDCLNYLAGKQIIELFKAVPTETDELAMIEDANNRLRRMENRLDIATKRFCVVNADNKGVREEIHRLLVERGTTTEWAQELPTVLLGLRTALRADNNLSPALVTYGATLRLPADFFVPSKGNNDDCEFVRQLISKMASLIPTQSRSTTPSKLLMQKNLGTCTYVFLCNDSVRPPLSPPYDGPLKSAHIDSANRAAYTTQASNVITTQFSHAPPTSTAAAPPASDLLLPQQFTPVTGDQPIRISRCGRTKKPRAYASTDRVATVIKNFKRMEIENFSTFVLLCEVLEESIIIRRDLERIKQIIMDQRDINEAREEKQEKRIAEMSAEWEIKHGRTMEIANRNEAADNTLAKVLKGVADLVSLAQCDWSPLLSLLGNHKDLTKWNVTKFLKILETEVKSQIEVAYGAVKPPPPTPQAKGIKKGAPGPATTKLVDDPFVEPLRPNRIEKLVPYQPCAYCVEDYIMNLVFETPAVPADAEYVQGIFHLEDENTKFGIYTLTIPAKRHPYRGSKKD